MRSGLFRESGRCSSARVSGLCGAASFSFGDGRLDRDVWRQGAPVADLTWGRKAPARLVVEGEVGNTPRLLEAALFGVGYLLGRGFWPSGNDRCLALVGEGWRDAGGRLAARAESAPR